MLNQPEEPQARAGEDPETRNMTKSQIFKLLSGTYFLPTFDSRALSRSYLLQVRRHAIFRIERHALLQFEATLELEHHAKKGSHNLTILVERLETLLQQLGERPLGFRPGCYPEECWVHRVVRFVDRSNLLEVFKLPIPGAIDPAILANRM